MATSKFLAPVDENIVFDPVVANLSPVGRDQHQGFLQQVFDNQPGGLPRVVHDADIEQAVGKLPHQAR